MLDLFLILMVALPRSNFILLPEDQYPSKPVYIIGHSGGSLGSGEALTVEDGAAATAVVGAGAGFR